MNINPVSKRPLLHIIYSPYPHYGISLLLNNKTSPPPLMTIITRTASFSYPDINGKTVSLADLKGKYIYIDVWATWCGPCRGELPALKELEEKYAGKDIHFVSLSCDKNKKAWENMVTKDQLKGIQLHMGTDRTFMDAYLINGIPRFILLDRDGKIISANMTRPSDPKTAEKFNELLGL